jgi:hypothetical protein
MRKIAVAFASVLALAHPAAALQRYQIWDTGSGPRPLPNGAANGASARGLVVDKAVILLSRKDAGHPL